ncbi:MAG: hypothetical protein M4D80_09540 [Myxococcota bacterium]|nr:hypothetical protein [Myxococcota bacterium]
MNVLRHVAATACVLLAAATPALAQPGAEELPPPPPPAQPQPPPPDGGTIVTIQPDPGQGAQSQQPPVRAVVAPMNENWNNVSHINGHPVPVGERGNFLYAHKKTNISTNPIGWMFGFYGLSVSHAVSPNIAVRADANLFNFDHDNGYEIGLTVPIYFKRVYQGPFLEGGLMVRQFDNDDCWDGEDCQSAANVGPQVLFGWHWTFDSGANVAFALGAFRPMNQGKTSDDVEPAGYFRIGYAY